MIHVHCTNATYYAVMGERARISAGGIKSDPFYVTFVAQNHQLNHLPPTDLKNLYHLASSELSLHFTEKNSPVTLTVFLIKLLGNYTRTDRHTHTDRHTF